MTNNQFITIEIIKRNRDLSETERYKRVLEFCAKHNINYDIDDDYKCL